MLTTTNNKLPYLLGILCLCFFLSPCVAEERWQVVILADASYESPIELSELHNIVSQRLTLALSAADFDVHRPQYLGLPNCIVEDCSGLTDQRIRQQAADSGKDINLALLYQITLTKQAERNIDSWNFKLSGRLLDLENGTEQDAFTLDSRMNAVEKNCLGQCFRDRLEQHAGLLAQELGAILSEKLASLSRRFSYLLALNNFTPDELQEIDHYLKNVDAYIADTLLGEFDAKAQWLHQVSSREYRYVSQQSSSELGNQLQAFLSEQGIPAELRYESEQRLFTLTRVGTPYLAAYFIAIIILILLTLFIFLRLKKQSLSSLDTNIGVPQQSTYSPEFANAADDRANHSSSSQASNEYSPITDLPASNRHQGLWLFSSVLLFVFLLAVLSSGAYWYYDSKQVQAVAIELNEAERELDGQELVEQADTSKTPIDHEIEQQKRLELSAWYQAKGLNSIGSYQHYLNEWPQGQYAVYAKQVLNFKLKDRSAWQSAQNSDSVVGYQHYIDVLPMGEFAERAQEKRISLLAQQEKVRELQELMNLADECYFSKKDYQQALYYYQQAANQGLAQAQYQLASMYTDGHGVKQDDRQAAQWYRPAAEQGHKQAQTRLGYMYSKGLGLKQSNAQALNWYRKAAEQSVMTAQYNLAYMYDKGQGVRQNYPQAAFWYEKAAEQGDADAQNNLGKLYENGLGVIKDITKAKALYRQAASQGHQAAKINLLILGK